jgi:hypothetical protein
MDAFFLNGERLPKTVRIFAKSCSPLRVRLHPQVSASEWFGPTFFLGSRDSVLPPLALFVKPSEVMRGNLTDRGKDVLLQFFCIFELCFRERLSLNMI